MGRQLLALKAQAGKTLDGLRKWRCIKRRREAHNDQLGPAGWSKEATSKTLAHMRCQRKTYAECAAHLGRSEVSCRRKLSKLGMARGVRWTPYEDSTM